MRAPTLAGVELLCPDLEGSRTFFTEVLGLVESDASEEAVMLRCVGEAAHATVVLRRGPRPGLGEIELLDAGVHDTSLPKWPSRTTDGHPIRVISRRQHAAPHRGERLVLNQPTPLRGVGVEPRRLAHVGLAVPEPTATAGWWCEQLAYVLRETVDDERGPLLATVAAASAPCDVLFLRASGDCTGALHHVAFAVDQRDRIADAALLFAELGIPVEVGLGQHGVGQLSYLYAFEPSGNRIALVHTPMVWEPDAEPVHWPAETWLKALWLWGAPPNASFFESHT